MDVLPLVTHGAVPQMDPQPSPLGATTPQEVGDVQMYGPAGVRPGAWPEGLPLPPPWPQLGDLQRRKGISDEEVPSVWIPIATGGRDANSQPLQRTIRVPRRPLSGVPEYQVSAADLAKDGTPEPTIVDPTPVRTPTPQAIGDGGRVFPPEVARWRSLAAQYDWPVDEVLEVMACESGGDPGATNGPYRGLMQIWLDNALGQNLYDPATNLAVAYQMWSVDGWAQWECKP